MEKHELVDINGNKTVILYEEQEENMLSPHDKMVYEYMQENFNGKCEFNNARECDGLCNNCPFDYHRKIEKLKAAGKYTPDYSQSQSRKIRDDNDYEGAILARQELYFDQEENFND